MAGHLFRNMVLFGRLVRGLGLDVTPQQMTDWLSAVELIDVRSPRDFRNVARTVLVRRREDLEWFERAFDLFWQERDPNELSRVELGELLQRTTKKRPRTATRQAEEAEGNGEGREGEEPEIEKMLTYSDTEVLRHKDFAELSGDELEEVKTLLQSLAWRLDTRRTRRLVAARRGRQPDLRRALRRSLTSGELLHLPRRERKRKRRPLTLLCDISGSMEAYSRILLQFIYVISNRMDKVEAFVFGTRLTRVTPYLRERDIDRSLKQVLSEVRDFGSGTRTGEALKEFNDRWSRRVLSGGAVVMIISDGWDRGSAELLSRQMERLQKSCHRLVWLNPLLGSPSYRPLTRGIRAALPWVDDFLPVHNLASLEQLGRLLQNLGEERPERRQRLAPWEPATDPRKESLHA